MRVIADLSIEPIGTGVSMSKYISACEDVLDEAGLNHRVHAWGTNVEGEWDAVMSAVQRCLDVVHEMGVIRIYTTLKLDTRTDREQTLQEKVRRFEKAA